jgi:hypothetical protein
MARARQVIAAGGSLIAHAGLLAMVVWMLTGEEREQPPPEVARIIPIDLPLLPVALSERRPPEPQQEDKLENDKEKDTSKEDEKAEREKVGASIRWPSQSGQGVAGALRDFTKIDCWPADDEIDIDECLAQLARHPDFDRQRRLMAREVANGHGWLLPSDRSDAVPDRQRVLAAEIDKSYRDDLAERGSPSPIPEDPYAR